MTRLDLTSEKQQFYHLKSFVWRTIHADLYGRKDKKTTYESCYDHNTLKKKQMIFIMNSLQTQAFRPKTKKDKKIKEREIKEVEKETKQDKSMTMEGMSQK